MVNFSFSRYWYNHTLNPLLAAFTNIPNLYLGLIKYKCGASINSCFILLNAFCFTSVQLNLTPSFSNLSSGCVILDKFLINRLSQLISLKDDYIAFLVFGFWSLKILNRYFRFSVYFRFNVGICMA